MRMTASFGLTIALVILPLAGCESLPQSGELTGANSSSLGGSLSQSPEPSQQASAKPEGTAGPVDGMLRLAADIEQRGEKGTALTFYERAATASNGDPAVHLQVADASLRMGYPLNAVNAYQVVLAKQPENGRALLGVGTALAKSGQPEEGLPYLARAAPLVNTASAYDRLGVANVMAGRPRDALASFEQAHRMNENDPDISTNLALAAALTGQHDKAIDVMKAVAARANAEPHHKRNLVLVMGIGGRGSEAQAAVKDLAPDTVQSLLDQAKSIRAISSPKARALALGTASTATR